MIIIGTKLSIAKKSTLSNRILQMLTISWLGNGTKNIAAHPHFRSRFLTYLERRDNPLEFIREYLENTLFLLYK